MTMVWGIHNDTLTSELLSGGFVSIGWDELGDLRQLGPGREFLKQALVQAYPDRKPRAVAAWAGILSRFRDEMQPSDVVVAPYKPDSTINIGVITGGYTYDENADLHRHRRMVSWRKVGVPRTEFTQAALYEVGAFLTVFRIRKHTAEFLAALGSPTARTISEAVAATAVTIPEEEVIDEPRASRIDRHTRDFVLKALLRDLTPQDFEEFTADLLRALGYQARVTSFTQDGGVDVIAHRDPLGVEPPLLKVQCKHQTGSITAPDVQRLIGTHGHGELALFVTLGGYSRDAIAIERQRPGLRLVTGEDVVGLVLDNYDRLSSRWRSLIPLTRVLVVSDSADL